MLTPQQLLNDKRTRLDQLLDELSAATRERNAAAIARIKADIEKLRNG